MERDFRFSPTPDRTAAFQDGTNLSLPQRSFDTSAARNGSVNQNKDDRVGDMSLDRRRFARYTSFVRRR